jgi:hypothetical protein
MPAPVKHRVTKAKVKRLYCNGATDATAAKSLGVAINTMKKYMKELGITKADVESWKVGPDLEVASALRMRAIGYSCKETKAQWVESQVKDPETDKYVTVGRWETIDMIKHHPPETAAAMAWLKNRQPGDWKDRHDVGVNGDMKVSVTVNFVGADDECKS